MTNTEIADAISESVERYVFLKDGLTDFKLVGGICPYADLGLESIHDLHIACEVQAILGIKLPPEKRLFHDGRHQLTFEQSVDHISKYLQTHPEAAYE